MNNNKSLSIELPAHYRHDNFLSFHQRDTLMLAEHVRDNTLTKGIVWEGKAALLTIAFQNKNAEAVLHIDNGRKKTLCKNEEEFKLLVIRMLGLQQNIHAFEQQFKNHPEIGQLIAKNPGLRVAVSATPFEALTWAITGQQISLSAAISIRRKFIQLAGIQHSSGLWCYPNEHSVSTLDTEKLRHIGFSQTKAKSLISLSDYLVHNQISLNKLNINNREAASLSTQLLAIPGIGPWTINYALLRGFGWLDGSLHGDVAVRRSLQTLLESKEKISEKETEQWLATFSPWRALVAAHLWAM